MKRFKVFYAKTPIWMLNDKLPLTVADVNGPLFAMVCRIDVLDLQHVFSEMQGEVWSPNGEAMKLITGLGLSHTSMSVGDVAYDVEEDKYWQVASIGWREVLVQ
jgi:hypothetical protein